MLPLPACSMFFMAAGGSAQDRAKESTPASAMAHVIEVSPVGGRGRGAGGGQ